MLTESKHYSLEEYNLALHLALCCVCFLDSVVYAEDHSYCFNSLCEVWLSLHSKSKHFVAHSRDLF